MYTGSLTRRALGTIAAVAVATVCAVGCSSSTGGTGTGGTVSTPPAGSVSTPAGSVSTPVVPVSTPAVTVTTGGGGGGGGGTASDAAFCKDFNLKTFASLQADPSAVKNYVGAIDKLTAEAPAAIKKNMEELDGFVHEVAGGHAPTAAEEKKLTPVAEAIGEWIGLHCTAS
jgi:hypothetical protein